jgi:chromate reductase, NAD(P)H dehydrogenase (quinone)
MKIVAISGSLRAASSNSALLHAAAAIAPEDVEFVFYKDLSTLPHFNPDLDHEGAAPPPAVKALRDLLRDADGVIISSPEYAHGLPGSLKNALDWVVSSGELTDKPVVQLNASAAGGQMAQASLSETLRIMGAKVLDEASRTAPFVRKKLDREGAVDQETSRLLKASVDGLVKAIRAEP